MRPQQTQASNTASPSSTTDSPVKKDPEKVETKTKKNANGTTTTITTVTNRTTERGKVTTIVSTTTVTGVTTTKKKVTTEESATLGTKIITEETNALGATTKKEESSTRVTRAALDSVNLQADAPTQVATANPQPQTDALGLPRQPVGSIDLADGRAEGIALSDESKRIKGYESSASVITTPEILTLAPGSIIALSSNFVPEPFDREWRLYSVSHKFPGGTSELTFYTPQAAPDKGSAPAPTQTGQTATVPTQAPGKFIFPVPKGATTIGDGYGTRAGRPPGYMHKILDVTAPQGTPVVAMADGVVSKLMTPNESGGGGYVVVIDYGGGYQCMYMHIMANGFLVKAGEAVKQGQAVAKIGSTGRSSGPHLHLKFTRNSEVVLLSQVGINVLKMGLPVQRYNETCNKY